MSEFSAKDLATALKSDGNLLNGEKVREYDFVGMLWYESNEGDTLDILGLGQFEVIEHVTGINTGDTDEYNGGYTVWNNWVILKQGDRYFKLTGTDDSWDGQGWDGRAVEVERAEKVVPIWEVKHDYRD